MRYRQSIRFKFRTLFVTVFLVVTIFLSCLMAYETLRITKNISQEYAQLYSTEIVGEINAVLQREIALMEKAAHTEIVIKWMENENDPELKRLVFNEISQFNDLGADHNFFVVNQATNHFYYIDKHIPFEEFKPVGTLSRNNEEDKWYYNSLEMPESHMLNIDTDRFMKTLRAWINVKVTYEGQTKGVLGTGLYLDPFVKEIFEKRNNAGAKSIIINEFGAVQMDSDIENIRQNSFESDENLSNTVFEFCDLPDFTTQMEKYLANGKEPGLISLSGGNYDFVAMAPIRDTNWHVVTFFSADSLFELSNFLPIMLMVIVVLLVLAAFITSIVYRTFVRPFEKLNESIQTEGSAPGSVIFGVTRDDEFGVLANTIQGMKTRLDRYNKDLEMEVSRRSGDLEKAYLRISGNEQRLERLLKTLPVGIFILDQDKNFVYGNPHFLHQFGAVSEEQFKERFYENQEAFFADPKDYERLKSALLEDPELVTFEFELNDLSQKAFWADVRLTRTQDEAGQTGYEGILINVQVKKDYELKLMDLATVDKLTGIYNRMYFDHMVDDEIHRSSRYEEALSLVMFDLDHFKAVNDTWGHAVGDDVLALTASVVGKAIRKSDILARWGGEEFAILMPHTSQEGAEKVAEKIRMEIEAIDHRLAGKVTASFGVAERGAEEAYENWFKRVDNALFRAKRLGRNRVVACEQLKSGQPAFVKLIWKKRFESGNVLIDDQHHQLFEFANGLMDLVLEPDSFELEKVQFEKTISHIVQHFKDEEALLEELGFDELEAHRAIHQELIQQTLDIQEQFFSGKLKASAVFAFIIDEVIVNHLLKEDIKFFDLTEAGKKK